MGRLTLQDGTVIRVPDGATPDQIKAILRARSGEQPAAPREFVGPPVPPEPTREEQLGMPEWQQRTSQGMRRISDLGIGVGDVAVSAARGTVNQPARTAQATMHGVIGAVNPNDTFREAYKRARDIGQEDIEADRGIVKSERLRTPQGEAVAGALGKIPGVALAGTAVDWVGDKIEQVAGPEIRDMITSAVVLGSIGRVGPRGAHAPGAITPEQVKALGIDITRPGQEIAQQIQKTVSEMRAPVRGEDLPAIQRALQDAEFRERTNVTKMYDDADQLGGRMKIPSAARIEAGMTDLNERWNVYDMNGVPVKPRLAARMEEASNYLKEQGGNFRIRLADLERYRQRISNDARKVKDGEERAGLEALLREVDAWETHAFTEVVAGGNKPAYEAFLKARGANAAYRDKFTGDRVLDNLLNDRNVTTAELRGYLWNSSSVVGPRHAGEIVRRMKNILGEDSPEIAALRQDMLYDIVAPMVEAPTVREGLGKFIQNYERTRDLNPDLVRQLAPFSVTHLDQAYTIAKALEKSGLTESALATRFDAVRVVTRILGGRLNRLAAGTAKLNVIDAIVGTIANTVKPNRRRMYEQLFGYSPSSPVITNSRRLALAATIAQEQGDE